MRRHQDMAHIYVAGGNFEGLLVEALERFEVAKNHASQNNAGTLVP